MPRTLTFAGVKSLGFTSGSPPSWTKPGADTTLAEIQHSTPYSDSVKAVDNSANPYNVSYDIVDGFFPIGILFDPVTGQVSGTTTTAGPWSVTIRAQNEFGGVLRTFTGTVAELPLAPTFVSQTYNTGSSSTVSLTMPARQSGDIAILTFSSYLSSIPPFALSISSQGPDAANWIRVFNTYFGGSVMDEQGGAVYRIDYGLHQTYYRVMTNTSTDNFTYNLPQSMTWQGSVMIVRGQSGHSFNAFGGALSGISAAAPPPQTYFQIGSFSANNRPKSLINNYHVREMSPSGTAQGYVSNNFTTWRDGSATLNGTTGPTLTNAISNSSRFIAYKHDIQSPTATSIGVGPYINHTQTEVWLMGSYGYLEWYRT